MNITVIGAGNVGSAVARGASGAGHAVVIAARNQAEVEAVAAHVGAQPSTDLPAAVAEADVVVLAIPYDAVADVAASIAEQVRGKVVVDATNPIAADFSGLAVSDRSGAEEVQDLFGGAPVVKAFNTVFAANQAQGVVEGIQLDGFYAGDDQQAKQTAAELLASFGFRPVDAGSLKAAQALEHMAFLNISLNAANGWSWQSGWKLVGPLG
ncbi:MAG: 8-hydroxy-5-deazaflavin:NADPH oxidoreductase [Frankiaceae bacterium]|jgi:predicted dinucleotide-binding enzyme|nr:8-hydroxy-5-deazaflavin:NADPH oxidoreductase [Frankiaceae bacterium]